MKTIYLTLALIVCGINLLPANNGLVPLYVNGNVIQAEHLEKGLINFYRSVSYEINWTSSRNGMYAAEEKIQVERFFLGAGDVLEEVTSYNYKFLIKKYLPKAKELHKRLGQVGFRFENVRYMIQYYNKFKG